jgi:hypothetical protein
MAGAIVRPGGAKTTGENASTAAKANAAMKEQANKNEAATPTERASNPGTVRSKNFELRDPSTGIFFPAGKLTEVPYFSGWLISQIEADIIELVSGDPEKDRAARADAHANKLKAEIEAAGGGADEISLEEDTGVDKDGNPVKRKDESDEDFAKRVEAHGNK